MSSVHHNSSTDLSDIELEAAGPTTKHVQIFLGLKCTLPWVQAIVYGSGRDSREGLAGRPEMQRSFETVSGVSPNLRYSVELGILLGVRVMKTRVAINARSIWNAVAITQYLPIMILEPVTYCTKRNENAASCTVHSIHAYATLGEISPSPAASSSAGSGTKSSTKCRARRGIRSPLWEPSLDMIIGQGQKKFRHAPIIAARPRC